MLFLIIYITVLWLLILAGGYILLVVGKIELDNIYLESLIKASIAISMSILWIYIMIILRDKYMKRIS